MGDFTVPALFMGAGQGAEGFAACAPTEDNYHAYYTHAQSAPAYEHLLPDAGHMDFADNVSFLLASTCPTNANADAVKAVVGASSVAFLKVYLDGDETYQPWLDGDQASTDLIIATKN